MQKRIERIDMGKIKWIAAILYIVVAFGTCATPKGGKIISKIQEDDYYTIYTQDDTGVIRSYDVSQDVYNALDYGDYYGGN